ncbi:hypothetical protein M405DRAFT_614562 [Rhizopogon salebrosus TDB-379]|nr:hypothetical protein M405DRAFT_614562 [Rhizopogon salebrosus TDB-379]
MESLRYGSLVVHIVIIYFSAAFREKPLPELETRYLQLVQMLVACLWFASLSEDTRGCFRQPLEAGCCFNGKVGTLTLSVPEKIPLLLQHSFIRHTGPSCTPCKISLRVTIYFPSRTPDPAFDNLVIRSSFGRDGVSWSVLLNTANRL